MIEKINLASVNSSGSKPQKKQPQFTGLVDGLIKTVQVFEQNPMANVSFLDVTTAIGPRAIYDTVNTNPYAGLETFRRESSGLFVNCLIPSFVVLGMAKLVQNPIMGKGSKMGSSWANEETIKTVAKYWQAAEGEGELKVRNTYKNLINDLSGIDGEEKVLFKDFDHSKGILKLTNATVKPTKYSDRQVKKALKLITEKTHVSEHVQTGSKIHSYDGKLSSILEGAPTILKEFIKHNIKDEAGVADFVKKSTKLVTAKSLLGLAVIIPLAISMQPINRWITAKTSGIKGAPIYKDFQKTEQKPLTSSEKASLFKDKLVSVGTMVGVALLSIMKKPNMSMLKNITQFSGIFPTMDQARIIATATFASRMMASENKDELKETTVRDIATFSAFYFLGDHVAKGIASGIQKFNPKIVLINELEKLDKNANGAKKFWHWVKNTSLKSSDEVVGEAAKRMRSVCQLGNIGFSLLSLGILIPMITKTRTFKKREEELAKMKAEGAATKTTSPIGIGKLNHANKGTVYQEFFTAR